jgi:hypothetical protein
MSDYLIDEDTDLLAGEFVLGTLDSEERANAQSLLRLDHGFIAMVRIWERRFGELHLMVEPVEPDAKIFQRIKAKIAEISPGAPAPDGKPPAEAVPSPEPPPEPTGAAATPEMPKPEMPADGVTDAEIPKPPDVPANGAMPKPPDVPVDAAAATAESAASADTFQDRRQEPRPRPVPEITVDVIRSRGRWRAFGLGMTVLLVGLVAMLAIWRFVPDRLPAVLRPANLMMSIGIDPGPQGLRVKPAPPESQFDE